MKDGASPKETKSATLSKSLPKTLSCLRRRAAHPSRPSKTIEARTSKMEIPVLPLPERYIASKPADRLQPVNILGINLNSIRQSSRIARIVSPPLIFSQTFTLILKFCGIYTWTREPNSIIPILSPCFRKSSFLQ